MTFQPLNAPVNTRLERKLRFDLENILNLPYLSSLELAKRLEEFYLNNVKLYEKDLLDLPNFYYQKNSDMLTRVALTENPHFSPITRSNLHIRAAYQHVLAANHRGHFQIEELRNMFGSYKFALAIRKEVPKTKTKSVARSLILLEEAVLHDRINHIQYHLNKKYSNSEYFSFSPLRTKNDWVLKECEEGSLFETLSQRQFQDVPIRDNIHLLLPKSKE